MKRIVVIDSGINKFTGLQTKNIIKCIDVSLKEDDIKFKDISLDDICDDINHGTSVMAILQRYCDDDDEFIVIKAYNDEFEIPSYVLTKTLQYVDEFIECDIINLCCGCVAPEDKEQMENVCESLKNKGVVIIAAFSNEGMISYPAGFQNVIGVDYSLSCFSPKEYYYIENSIINIRGIGHPQNLPIGGDIREQQSGASFVVPHITGLLMKNKDKLDFESAMDFLKYNAKKVVTFPQYANTTDSFHIKRAVIFPYSKETDVLLRFSEMLDFEIDSVLCTKHQLLSVLKKINEIQEPLRSVSVSTIDSFDWGNKSIDTLIIGHINLISEAVKRNLKSILLNKAIEYKKNVYMFDEIDNDERLVFQLLSGGNQLYIPKVHTYFNNNYGKLHILNCPLISIFGTGPKQGKFSLQLGLRRYLTSIGYKVANFGTEPTSTLFGFDSCYPYGYNSTVHVEGEAAIAYINNELAKIDKNNPDIIFLGTQSQTIPTGNGNIGFYNHKQYEIILAAQPDAHLLCVYVNDDTEYVLRTINFLESVNDSKVIGIIVFPYIYENRDGILSDVRSKETKQNIEQAVYQISEATCRPVFSFLDLNLNNKLLSIIQDTFSEE